MFQPTEDILLVYLVITVHTLMKLSNPSKFAMVINSTTTSNITGSIHMHTQDLAYSQRMAIWKSF